MATRSRSQWKPDSKGQFTRQVGWKVTISGKRSQPKFRLGTDSRKARRREQLLQQVWHQIEVNQPDEPLWTEDTLYVAQQVAKGQTYIQMPPRGNETQATHVIEYSTRVYDLSKLFPMLYITPAVGFKEPDEYEELSKEEKMRAYQLILGQRVLSWSDVGDEMLHRSTSTEESSERF